MISPCLSMGLNGNWLWNLGKDPGGNRPRSRSGFDRSDREATRSRGVATIVKAANTGRPTHLALAPVPLRDKGDVQKGPDGPAHIREQEVQRVSSTRPNGLRIS